VIARLLLLFILIPLADLVLLVMLLRGNWLATTLWILISGLAGLWYLRRQGTQVLHDISRSLDGNRMPGDALLEMGQVALAGILLIIPGVITDLLGISLLIPACRAWYRRQFAAWLKRRFRIYHYADGEFRQVVDAKVVRSPREEKTVPHLEEPPGRHGEWRS
jgi:UPF0716 protein FxsA